MTPPAKTTRQESAAQRYVRLLSRLEGATARINTGAIDTIEDVQAFAELKNGSFIEGVIVNDKDGNLSSVIRMAITVSGRLMLDDLRDKEALFTSIGLWKAHRWKVYAFFGCTIVAAFIGGLVALLMKSLEK